MTAIERWNHNFAVIGWGALFIWWGIVVMIDPITIGMGAIGTGLIFLGVSIARWLAGVPMKNSSVVIGTIALVWGALDTVLQLRFGPSLATLLIVIGLVVLGSLLAHTTAGNTQRL